MKYFCIVGIVILLSFSVKAGGEQTNKDETRFVLLSADTLVNGFRFIPHDIVPFSPVIEAEINLPESSIVALFITDTLLKDTCWICQKDELPQGIYRIRPQTYPEFSGQKEPRIVILHFVAWSVCESRIGFPANCSFTASWQIARY
jgi:hypothetical protein